MSKKSSRKRALAEVDGIGADTENRRKKKRARIVTYISDDDDDDESPSDESIPEQDAQSHQQEQEQVEEKQQELVVIQPSGSTRSVRRESVLVMAASRPSMSLGAMGGTNSSSSPNSFIDTYGNALAEISKCPPGTSRAIDVINALGQKSTRAAVERRFRDAEMVEGLSGDFHIGALMMLSRVMGVSAELKELPTVNADHPSVAALVAAAASGMGRTKGSTTAGDKMLAKQKKRVVRKTSGNKKKTLA
jgi:hypothetical protein